MGLFSAARLGMSIWRRAVLAIGVARGPWLPDFLEYLVISCFKKRYPKRNTVARLKSNILPPQHVGLATPLVLA